MNVACTACPAKYAVPDERVRGKRVRITCKHCGTFIVVDGTTLGASSGSQVGPLPQSAVANAARERRKTMLGIGGAANPNANAAASLGVPSDGRGATAGADCGTGGVDAALVGGGTSSGGVSTHRPFASR